MTKLIATTETGSVYEIDNDKMRIRRVFGIDVPTPRIKADGTWIDVQDIIGLELGKPLIFVYQTLLSQNDQDKTEIILKTTVTSPLKELRTVPLPNLTS